MNGYGNPLAPYRQPLELIVPDRQIGQVARGSVRPTPEEAMVVIAERLPELLLAMARTDRDVVSLTFKGRVEGFFYDSVEPVANITVETWKR